MLRHTIHSLPCVLATLSSDRQTPQESFIPLTFYLGYTKRSPS